MVKAWELGFAPLKFETTQVLSTSLGQFMRSIFSGFKWGAALVDGGFMIPGRVSWPRTLYKKNNSLDKNDVKSHADDVVQLYVNPIAKERKEDLWEIGID